MSKPIDILKEILTEEPFISDLPKDWEVARDNGWEDNGKFDVMTAVVSYIKTGQLFSVVFTRDGDHWSGYETSFDDAYEVEAYTKTVTAYRKVVPNE